MIVFALVAAALFIVGTSCAKALWTRLDAAGVDATSSAEMLNAGALIGLATWLAVNWLLALTHTLTAPALWAAVIALCAGAAWIALKTAGALARLELPETSAIELPFLAPLFMWLIYVLWRGKVLPPASHDALAYHLPKAVLLMRAEGYQIFRAGDYRIPIYPFNYELLLADIMILTRSDALTEWLGAVSYVLLLVVAVAFARRWWRSSLAASIATVLAAGSAPVLLLHSGADKNDLLTAWLAASALLWGARWCIEGGRMPMLLTILALGLGFGTKSLVAAVGVALVPFLLYRLVKTRASIREVGLTAIAAIATFVFGGGVSYAVNYFNGAKAGSVAATAEQLAAITYGDWSNLWQVPYLMLTVPFSGDPWGVWVPWRHELWFWPHYEIFFSHYGRLFTVLVVLAPLVSWKLWRRGEHGRERWIAAAAAAIAIAVMLPTQLRPVGFFGAFPRYFAFIVPIVAAWVVAPVIDAVTARSRPAMGVLATAIALIFAGEAVTCALHDRFAPLEYAIWARDHPGTRFIWFNPFRAGSIVDRYAGPREKVAVDSSFETWVHPAFGRDLQRPVMFLPTGATASDIPADAAWVMIDRSWSALWGNPEFRTMGQMAKYIGHGTASPDDLRLYEILRGDRRFRLVYRDEKTNQAVFRRVAR